MGLLIILIFMVCCALLAKNKNRSMIGWGIAGALVGIFALVLLAILPKLPPTNEF